MFLLELLKTILLGIVEGITEWLPISSTGHLILLNNFIKLDVSEEFWDMFEVVIQLGAILAVVLLFWKRLSPSARISRRRKSAGSGTCGSRSSSVSCRRRSSGSCWTIGSMRTFTITSPWPSP